MAAMLRIVRAVQFIFDKLAALLATARGATKCVPMSFSGKRPASPEARLTNMPHSRPATTRLQCRKRTTNPDREKLIRRRWLETGIKMWNPDHHGAGHAALNIQGRAELLPPKPGETLPGYDTLEFKIVQSYVNGEAVNQIVCEGVVVDPPKRRGEVQL